MKGRVILVVILVSGMLLAAPMTAIAKIVFERIEVTKPLAGLMEGRLETLDEI